MTDEIFDYVSCLKLYFYGKRKGFSIILTKEICINMCVIHLQNNANCYKQKIFKINTYANEHSSCVSY